MANILVTGGRGFIGTNLTNELRSRGHDVWTCDNPAGRRSAAFKADVGVYQRWTSFSGSINLSMSITWPPNTVVERRGSLRESLADERHWHQKRSQTAGAAPLRMIFFSSAEVYGDYDELMSEDVMERVPIKQMNDYAISKWGGELQCLNHATMFGNEIVRVRPVGCYGPHEYYSPYRGVIPILVYSALKVRSLLFTRGHKRIFDYVEDTCRTFANISENFVPGEVYNVGGKEDWVVSIEELSDIVLEATGASSQLAEFKGEEGFTTV